MFFRICEKDEQIFYRQNIVRLVPDDQDVSEIRTTFSASFYDEADREYDLGSLRIGRVGLRSGRMEEELPREFQSLPDHYFSLGADEAYYDALTHLGDDLREEILRSLKDVAYDTQILKKNLDEPVMKMCLLRGISVSEVKGQFHRMALGGARLTTYNFTYTAPKPKDGKNMPVSMKFSVQPHSCPPTNVHALIGRNGCGKTYLIRNMVQSLQDRTDKYGEFTYAEDSRRHAEFANVLCIAFSPFDNFAELIKSDGALPAVYVGLNKEKGNLLQTIGEQFWEHFENCLVAKRKQILWKKAIEILKCDATFRREGIDTFMDGISEYSEDSIDPEKKESIMSVFNQLSSGHKVVLLIITSCVAEIEERSILFLDEPENHLHPPLLSALIRALSDLLTDRNGVAIVSTHSPVVLQEVPRHCVWLLTRQEREVVRAGRLDRETFGSSLGALIEDAFHFEVNESGFHKMMVEAAETYDSFEEVAKRYNGCLGTEASILLRLLLRKKQWEAQKHEIS